MPILTGSGAFRLLLRHDLRLAWRDFRSHFVAVSDRALLALLVVLALVMHGAAWTTGTELAAIGAADVAARERVVVDLAPGMTFILLLMLAQALSGLTKTLYARGDLDLILSSPFPAPVVLALRTVAVGLGAMASAAIFAIPVVDVGLLHGAWRSLALVPVLVAGGLLTAGLGLFIVMGLFGVLGARRTRLAAQVVATFIGGGFMLWLQVRRFLPAGLSPFAMPSLLDAARLLPVRAAAGDGGALLGFTGLSAGVFALAVVWAAGRFAATVAAAATIPEPVRSAARAAGRDRRFDTRLGPILRHKEWRLLRRDPWLLSQLLLQMLYMTPMLLMLMRGTGSGTSIAVAVAPMIVVVCYQVSASVTWLSLSAEDAPELLATAPVAPSALRIGKLKSVGVLAACLATPPLVWLAWLDWRAATATALLASLGTAMAMQLSLWHMRPARRSSFAARHRESKLLALMEMVMSMLLGVTAALATAGSTWALVPLGLAGVVLLVNRPRSAKRDVARSRQAGQQAA